MDKLKNIYTKTVQTIGTGLYLMFLGFVITSVVSFGQALVNKQELTVFGLKPIYIISGSMEDGVKSSEIKKDSIIISKRVMENDIKDLKPGDVITFTLEGIEGFPNAHVTHRLIEINNVDNTFVSKGDANDVIDKYGLAESAEGYLSTSRIKYKMVMRNNWVSKILVTIRNKPMVFGLYTLSAVMGLVAVYIVNEQLYDKDLEIKLKKKK